VKQGETFYETFNTVWITGMALEEKNFLFANTAYLQMLKLAKTENNQFGIGVAYKRLGMLFEKLQYYPAAIEFFTKALVYLKDRVEDFFKKDLGNLLAKDPNEISGKDAQLFAEFLCSDESLESIVLTLKNLKKLTNLHEITIKFGSKGYIPGLSAQIEDIKNKSLSLMPLGIFPGYVEPLAWMDKIISEEITEIKKFFDGFLEINIFLNGFPILTNASDKDLQKFETIHLHIETHKFFLRKKLHIVFANSLKNAAIYEKNKEIYSQSYDLLTWQFIESLVTYIKKR